MSATIPASFQGGGFDGGRSTVELTADGRPVPITGREGSFYRLGATVTDGPDGPPIQAMYMVVDE